MKLNFGHGIFIFYILFVGSLGFQVYKSTTIDHTLVASNYYEQDLAFQQTLDARNRGELFPIALIQADDGQLELIFLKDELPDRGELHVMRPDSKVPDVVVKFECFEQKTNVSTTALTSGHWRARLEFLSHSQRVVKDFSLYLN